MMKKKKQIERRRDPPWLMKKEESASSISSLRIHLWGRWHCCPAANLLSTFSVLCHHSLSPSFPSQLLKRGIFFVSAVLKKGLPPPPLDYYSPLLWTESNYLNVVFAGLENTILFYIYYLFRKVNILHPLPSKYTVTSIFWSCFMEFHRFPWFHTSSFIFLIQQ